MPDFRVRSSEPEIMDDPRVPPEEMLAALDELERINRFLGGLRTSIAGIERALRRAAAQSARSTKPAKSSTTAAPHDWMDRPDRRVRLLDVGCGGGDVTEAIARWARRRAIHLEALAIDLSPICVARARERLRSFPEIEVREGDLFALDPAERFDIVHGSLVLHHLPGDEAARGLRAMWNLARTGVVVNDLHRHPLAWHGIRVVAGIFSRNRLIRNDGALSVLRAFTRGDWTDLARSAGLPQPHVRWRWAFRWEVTFVRDAASSLGVAPVDERNEEARDA